MMINSARVSMEVSNVSKLVDNLLMGLTNLRYNPFTIQLLSTMDIPVAYLLPPLLGGSSQDL